MLKKIFIFTILLLLVGCTAQPQLGKDIKDIQDTIQIGDELKSIEWTDENKGELLIIKSDNKDYYSLGGGIMAYFSITNISDKKEKVNILFYFGEGQYLRRDYVERFSHNSTVTITEYESATSSYKIEYDIKQDYWDKISLSDKKIETKLDKKSTGDRSFDKTFYDEFEIGETKYYRADIYVPKEIKQGDEWYIEAIGKESYGLLDPNNWTYEQLFNSLTDGNLSGQDSWSGSAYFDVSTTNPNEGAKGIIYNTAMQNQEVGRSITAITSGEVYFSVYSTQSGATLNQMFKLQNGATIATRVRFYDAGGGMVLQIDTGTWTTFASGLSTDTWYRIGYRFDCSTYKANVNLNNGTWSSDYNFRSNQAQINYLYMRDQSTYSPILNYWDTISPDYTPGGAPPSDPCLPTAGLPFFQTQDCWITSYTYHDDIWETNGYDLTAVNATLEVGKLIVKDGDKAIPIGTGRIIQR